MQTTDSTAGTPASDVFLSYAHLDDEPLLEGENGWVTQLCNVLRIRLSQVRGIRAEIWRDPRLRKDEHFNETIMQAIDSASLFLSVVSPRYLHSDFCKKELDRFLDRKDLRRANRSRLVGLGKTPVVRPPRGLEQQLSHQFFVREDENGKFRELDPRAHRETFLRKVDDLAQELKELLDVFCAAHGTESPRVTTPPAREETVFVARTSSDIVSRRELLERELKDRGFHVESSLATAPGVVFDDAQVAALLARCSVAVHLIGERYGSVPEDQQQSIVDLEYRAAAKTSIHQFVCIAAGSVAADPRQDRFLEHIREQAAARADIERIDQFEELKLALFARLQHAPAPAAKPASAPVVYLIDGVYDAAKSRPFSKRLFDGGFEVLSLEHGENRPAAELRQEHEDYLLRADACVIFFGASYESWVRKQIDDLRRAPGLAPGKQFGAKAIWIPAPVTDRQREFRVHDPCVVFEEEQGGWEKLLALLQRARGRP